MKTLSAGLATHIAGNVTTLATCWKITRRDGVVIGFTDHSVSLIIEGITYQAESGFTPSAIASSADLSVDNIDIEGMLKNASITENDIHRGKYDFAEIAIFLINYNDISQGKLILRTGWLGEITLSGAGFTAEVRGLSQVLSKTLGALYAPNCRAEFADSQCKKNKAAFTVSSTVTAAATKYGFKDSARAEAAGTFAQGMLTFTSGANAGVSVEIKEFSSGRFTFFLPVTQAPAIGDAYNAVYGCDKSITTCRALYANAVNFRGEPHVPGSDRLFETAGTRSQW